MTLTPLQTLGIILAVAAGTQLTRWLPFWLFPEKKQPPAVVAYLGKVLPPAMMGLLVVYCLRSISWLSAPHGAPELIAIAAVAGLHLWKRNVLLSIAGALCCTWCWYRRCLCEKREEMPAGGSPTGIFQRRERLPSTGTGHRRRWRRPWEAYRAYLDA